MCHSVHWKAFEIRITIIASHPKPTPDKCTLSCVCLTPTMPQNETLSAVLTPYCSSTTVAALSPTAVWWHMFLSYHKNEDPCLPPIFPNLMLTPIDQISMAWTLPSVFEVSYLQMAWLYDLSYSSCAYTTTTDKQIMSIFVLTRVKFLK